MISLKSVFSRRFAIINNGNAYRLSDSDRKGNNSCNESLELTSFVSKVDLEGEYCIYLYAGPALMIKFIEVPVAEEVHDWLERNLEMFVPFSVPPSQVVYDYKIGSTDGVVNNIVVAIFRCDMVEEIVEKFKAVGIYITSIKPACLDFIENEVKNNPDECIGHVVVDKAISFIFITIGDQIKLYKDIPLGEPEIINRSKDFALEVNSVLSDFWEIQQFGATLNTIKVYGRPLIKDYAHQISLDAVFVDIKQDISSIIALRAAQASFIKENSIELLTTESPVAVSKMRTRKIYRIFRHGILPILTILLILLLVFNGIVHYWESKMTGDFVEYQRKTKLLKNVTTQNKLLLKKMASVQNLLYKKSRQGDILIDIRKRIPNEIWLEQYNYQKTIENGSKIFITGFASQGEAINTFLKDLESAGLYRKTYLQSTQAITPSSSMKRTGGKYSGVLTYFKIELVI